MNGPDAMQQLINGNRVRLPHWDANKYLKMRPCEADVQAVGLYHKGNFIHWSLKPINYNYQTWELFELPEGIGEDR